MYAIKRLLISLIVFSACSAANTYAVDNEEASDNTIKQFGDWMVVKGNVENNDFCFAYTSPFRTKGFAGEYRSAPYFLLANKGHDEISVGINSGFIIDAEKGFTVRVNNTVHLMNVKLNENVWTYSASQDVSVLNDMIEDGRFVEARSYDNKDHIAVDYYSLNGFTHAFKHLSTNCEGIQTSSQ